MNDERAPAVPSLPDSSDRDLGTFGHYRLLDTLGHGGMGVVYRAFDTRQERQVALKTLPESLAGNEEFRARFEREARIVTNLEDPHVVPLHGFGEIDGRLYLDMRLIRGRSLQELLRDEGALEPARAVSLLEQVASALSAAHEAGLLHRDVKPSNILVLPARAGGAEFAYLADFGIARTAEVTTRGGLTSEGSTIGTLDYMSPEQFLGQQIDHRVDVYALGCLLYQCLTGRPPFSGEGLAALMYAHLNTPIPVLPEARPGTPPALDRVIAQAMAKDPNARLQGAAEFAAAARSALIGDAGHAPAPASTVVLRPAATGTAMTSPTKSASAWRRVVPIAAAAVLLAGIAGFAFGRGGGATIPDTASVASSEPVSTESVESPTEPGPAMATPQVVTTKGKSSKYQYLVESNYPVNLGYTDSSGDMITSMSIPAPWKLTVNTRSWGADATPMLTVSTVSTKGDTRVSCKILDDQGRVRATQSNAKAYASATCMVPG